MSDDAAIELAKMLGLKIEVKKEKVTHKKSTCRICEEEFSYKVKKGKAPTLCQSEECRKTHRRNIRKPKPKVIRKNVCVVEDCENVIIQTGKGRTITHCDSCKTELRAKQNAAYRAKTFVPLQRVGVCIDCNCQLETMTGRGKMKLRCAECQKKNHAKIARDSAKKNYKTVVRTYVCNGCNKNFEQIGRGKLRKTCPDCKTVPAKVEKKSAAEELFNTLNEEQQEAIKLWESMGWRLN